MSDGVFWVCVNGEGCNLLIKYVLTFEHEINCKCIHVGCFVQSKIVFLTSICFVSFSLKKDIVKIALSQVSFYKKYPNSLT